MCHEMSCSACAGFICCSRFRHEPLRSLTSSPAGREGPGGGPLARQRKRRAEPGNAPSRGEARPRPLPPSGRGEERRRPELLSSRLQEGRASAAGKLLSRLRGRLGGGPLSRQRKRRGQAFPPALPPFVTFAAFGAVAGVCCRHRSSFCRPGAGPCSARILRGRLCACRRAYRGGAARAPDCAREAEGAPLPSASHGFSESGAARPRNARDAAPASASPGTIITQSARCQAQNTNKNQFHQIFFMSTTLEGTTPPRSGPALHPPSASSGQALLSPRPPSRGPVSASRRPRIPGTSPAAGPGQAPAVDPALHRLRRPCGPCRLRPAAASRNGGAGAESFRVETTSGSSPELSPRPPSRGPAPPAKHGKDLDRLDPGSPLRSVRGDKQGCPLDTVPERTDRALDPGSSPG